MIDLITLQLPTLRGPLRGRLRVRDIFMDPHPEVRAQASLEGLVELESGSK